MFCCHGYVSLTPPTFSMCHPGMIHFILIDRSFDEMTTPSIHSEQPVVSISVVIVITPGGLVMKLSC